MRYARLTNVALSGDTITSGTVAEILPDGLTPAMLPADIAETCLECERDAVVEGWTFDGKAFAAPVEVVVAPVVPASVTKAQAKIALLRAGHLDMVKTAVGANPEAEIWFEDASIWERQNPYVIDLGEKLLGGPDVIDALFIAAAQISA